MKIKFGELCTSQLKSHKCVVCSQLARLGLQILKYTNDRSEPLTACIHGNTKVSKIPEANLNKSVANRSS
jgi:hypothetical protein